ncbi:CRISPR-associated helicase/endonuclease Cas3 [Ornatilinea apprima]|nr:CRISPR-associated helicase/endonuclease Cas3 [Ornatilinea apprima]
MEDMIRNHFYAHSKNGEEKRNWQLLIDHLINSSRLAEKFGQDAGISQLASTAALVHDLGKYSLEFQQRLEGRKIRVDHSTAGAKELCKIFKGTPYEPLATILAYCIVGHHTGLPDYGDSSDLPGDGTLLARLKTAVCDYSHFQVELSAAQFELPSKLAIRPIKDHWGFSFAFMTRMIFSAVVDADFQETQTYMQGEKPRGVYESIEKLRDRYNSFLGKFDAPVREIDIKRTQTMRSCIEKASLNPGFFTLTVPTGGGKTLSSMAFALNHATRHGLKRIIYVIPFTTIIEQNAKVFKDILGEENILEHHSNFDWEGKRAENGELLDNQTNNVFSKLKLAAENWDIPIVVTTNVQFFESLFANRSSRCRKLHNIAKSVIIFDEAQMFPRDYMYPVMYAIRELVTNYGASAVFCTATQPNLEKFLPEEIHPIELAPDPQELYNFYRRVEVKSIGKISDHDLIGKLNSEDQVLCIVNTRAHAKGLFDGLDSKGSYHLSTLMCPVHRLETMMDIRDRLSKQLPCRVVSTTVMEAGVDLDFPVGYRALTGLDSINQAAGRVNREMKRSDGKMFLFEPDSEFVKKVPKYIAQSAEITRMVLREFPDEPISIPAIQTFYNYLYSLKDKRDFDFKNILGCFDKSQSFMLDFADAAQKFRVIEEATLSVIIPYNQEALLLIDELKNTPYPFSTLRKLQPFSVSIYEQEYNALNQKGAIEIIADKFPALVNEKDYYHPKTGLIIPTSGGGDALFY